MALAAIELQETRNMNYSGGKTAATRRFAIWDDAAPLTTPKQIRDTFGTTINGLDIPTRNSLFPGEIGIYARSYSITVRDDGSGIWNLDWHYENGEPFQFQPLEIGYTQFSVDWSAEFRDVWRTNPGLVIPPFGSPNVLESDIGGRKVDSAGLPLSVLSYFSTIEFTETVALETLPDRSQSIRAVRGTRNAVDFQGAPRGQVVYKGARAQRVALDKVSLTHSFAQDAQMHLIQVPRRGADGQVLLSEASPGILRAAIVAYEQPFPDFTDFNALSENF
jgi:hypothetical protein